MTLQTTHPTLLDLSKRMAPDGSIDGIVEILNETNEILQDMVWQEGNLATGHMTTIRTGLPTPTWRQLYGGVQPTKSTTAQVTDTCGNLQAYAEVDADLAELNGNTAEFRLSENRPHIEGMNQEMADTLFMGNEGTAPTEFTGFNPRFNSLSAENADNIINSQTVTGSDGRSIWLVIWGPNTCHGIVPKGSAAGLQMEDKGLVTIEDASAGSNTGRMEAYRTHYKWKAGLTVRDWRYVVRIANIDYSAMSAVFASGQFNSGNSVDLPDLMFQALNRPPNLNAGRAAFYMGRDMLMWLGRQTSAKTQGSTLTAENVGGKLVYSFMGIPIRRCDSLQVNETAVS